MTLVQLLDKANEGYDDHFLYEFYNRKTGKFKPRAKGDGLARFIVLEIMQTFDEKAKDADQLQEALKLMENARDDVQRVIQALEQYT